MSQKFKIAIAGAIAMLALVAIAFFGALPILDQIDQSSTRFIEARQRLLRAEFATEDLDRMQRDLEQYQQLQGKLEQLLLGQGQIVEFLTIIEGLAKNLGLAYDIQLLTSQDKSQMNFQIKIDGQFIDVARFISGVENSPFLTKILRWQVSRGSQVSAQPQRFATSTSVSAGLTISVFAKQ